MAIQSRHFFMTGLGRPPHHGEDAICLERNVKRPVSQVIVNSNTVDNELEIGHLLFSCFQH